MRHHPINDWYVFALSDPFDEILRHLSESYLEAALNRLESVLAEAAVRFDDLRYGWLHPGLASIQAPDSPIAHFGWISTCTYEIGSEEERCLHVLQSQLSRQAPRLAWGDGPRGIDLEVAARDHAKGLAACIEFASAETTNWVPEQISSGPEDEPWCAVARAIVTGEHSAITAACDYARREYSEAGFAIVRAGFANWLRDAGVDQC